MLQPHNRTVVRDFVFSMLSGAAQSGRSRCKFALNDYSPCKIQYLKIKNNKRPQKVNGDIARDDCTHVSGISPPTVTPSQRRSWTRAIYAAPPAGLSSLPVHL